MIDSLIVPIGGKSGSGTDKARLFLAEYQGALDEAGDVAPMFPLKTVEVQAMVAKFVDDLLTFDVDPEKWRVLEVSIGGELGEGAYCDNSITTHKYNALTFLPRSLFEQFRRTANQ